MSNDTNSGSLNYKWIINGTVVGVLLSVLLFSVMKHWYPAFDRVDRIISLLGFIVMGILIGYKSPGYTIKEPAIGGLLTILITVPLFTYVFDYNADMLEKILAPIFGFVLALIGGWVGEELDHSEQGHDRFTKFGLEWGWIIAGTVIAFVLNNFFTFTVFPLSNFNVSAALISLGFSFLVAGIIVGYKSPGITIKEAAIAGLFSVVLNYLLLYVGFDGAILPMEYMAEGLVGGLALSLIGGWVGEKIQAASEKKKDDDSK